MALTRDRILDTAFELLSQYGLADLSMRRLATELGVAPGGLYYHVKNKQELLASLASRMLAGVDFAGQDGAKNLDLELRDSGGAGKLLPSGSRIFENSDASVVIGAFEQLYRTLITVKEAPEVVRLALALHPQPVGPDRLFFLDELKDRLGALVGESLAPLAAETLVHVALGFIEQQQTRALLTGAVAAPHPPPSFAQAIVFVLAGFAAGHL